MGVALADIYYRLPGPGWLTGPILDKELRVSSRRKINYFLRCAYLLVLTVFIAFVWLFTVSINASGSWVYRVSRMSVAATAIITTIAWFQFITIQLIAVVMLSNAISNEIRRHTFDVLMTTPTSTLQIIMGKLCSKMFQLVLLLAASLPLLAIVRAFGGVPWGYVIATVSITLTASVLAASVSLLLSISRRHAYSAITGSVAVGLLFYALLPALSLGLSGLTTYTFPDKFLTPVLMIFNPFAAMAGITESLLSASPTTLYSWPLHCLLMLAASTAVLALSVWQLRRAALGRLLSGQRSGFGLGWLTGGRKGRNYKNHRINERPISRVKGDPIVWKELPKSVKGRRISERVIQIILAAALATTYILGFHFKWLFTKSFHSVYAAVFVLAALVRTATLSAASIATEKESRSWPILLATPLDDWQIVRGKIVAVLKRTMPIWIILAVHVLLFIVLGALHPLAVVGLIFSVTPAVLFLIGCGLYFGMRLKTTTGAVAATFGLPLLLWFLCPCFSSFNPVFFAAMSMQIDKGVFEDVIAAAITLALFGILGVIVPGLIYGGLGVLFIWRAKCRTRYKIFG